MIEAPQTGIWLDSLRRLNDRGVVLFVCILNWQLVFAIDGDSIARYLHTVGTRNGPLRVSKVLKSQELYMPLIR